MTAKLSITLPEEILKALDRLIEERVIHSRSAAISDCCQPIRHPGFAGGLSSRHAGMAG
ncbi:ribbon-helix-helix domain-containing protein [Schaalia canis]|uniref:Ribbon-helix-helix protein, CopG family n=1 Tax=Schaalia canis TaxID=100469 RepID=A0A3P1SEC6_9ACTO|nr:ribbon-helix-helix protein, CopG family [Schaalia canis]